MLLVAGENAPVLELFIPPKTGLLTGMPWGDWKGLAPEGTLRRRPGVLAPWLEYIL